MLINHTLFSISCVCCYRFEHTIVEYIKVPVADETESHLYSMLSQTTEFISKTVHFGFCVRVTQFEYILS